MLNWEEIAARIENPHLCSPNEVQDLKDFCDKFPYSQVFPLLYLKVLSKGNHIQFEEELEKYAHKITNRVQLYNLLYVRQDTDISIEADFQNVIPEVQVDENEVINTELTTIEIQESISAIAREKPLEDVLEEKNESHVDELQIEVDELDMEIIASSVTASFILETREETSTESELPEFDMSISDDLEHIDSELDEFHNSDLNSNSATERTFLQWLTNSIETNEEENNTESTYEVSFIEFEKPKREFFSPIKKAKESLSEETLPVSETLAKIYQMQGNISKAIYVYQQLSLIIPEKKTYFASQIKSLKKKLN
jgi:hypothetical protein